MSIKCYSVRVKSLADISDKAVKICCYDGSEGIFPKSQIYGRDWDVSKSEAYWISAWILERKNIQYSTKKEANFSFKTKKMLPIISIKHHIPNKINKKSKIDDSLKR